MHTAFFHHLPAKSRGCARPIILAVAICLGAMGGATGCELERGQGDFGEQNIRNAAGEVDGGDGGDTGLPGLGEGPGAGTMTGTWMLVHESSTCVLGQEQVARAFYLVDVTQRGRALYEERRMCQIQLSPILGATPTISPEVLASVRFLDAGPGLITGLRTGSSYASSPEVALWGVDLIEPFHDPLPDDPQAPEVVDADGDGHPGVTFGMAGNDCQRYVAQRQIVRYNGELVRPNEVQGTSITVTDTAVLGATSPFCGAAPRVESNDAHSLFRMVRVDGAGGALTLDADGDGRVACADLAPILSTYGVARPPQAQNCERR